MAFQVIVYTDGGKDKVKVVENFREEESQGEHHVSILAEYPTRQEAEDRMARHLTNLPEKYRPEEG